MTFRADESAQAAYVEMQNYFLNPKNFPADVRKESLLALRELTEELGAVITHYPTWHPLVACKPYRRRTSTPCSENGYHGLDHTRFFVNGFITCPYESPDPVLKSVEKLREEFNFLVYAEILKFPLYSPYVYPVVVRCAWPFEDHEEDGTIPLRFSLPRLLRDELNEVENAQVAETWATMSDYFLGSPHGACSSHFVNLKNGRAMKRAWDCVIKTGIYGPIYK